MNIASAVALVRFLIAVRDLIDGVLASYLAKQKAEDLIKIEQAILDYNKGASIEEKSLAAEKVRNLFRKH